MRENRVSKLANFIIVPRTQVFLRILGFPKPELDASPNPTNQVGDHFILVGFVEDLVASALIND